jgi:NurA-like 5'-3' nuclease
MNNINKCSEYISLLNQYNSYCNELRDKVQDIKNLRKCAIIEKEELNAYKDFISCLNLIIQKRINK